MVDIHEPIWRDGFVLTRQHWQHYDRLNAHPALNGNLVVVQGGLSGAPDSGTTHRLYGVVDYRRWNLTFEQARVVVHYGRDLGGATWERFTWQGFDPHFHECLLGDDIPGIMDSVAIQQCDTYRAGGDGVAGTSGDSDPYRPNPIRNYQYQEDDVTPEEHKMLVDIRDKLYQFAAGEFDRDTAEAERDKRRFEELEAALATGADQLTIAINKISDRATKTQLTNAKNDILAALAASPLVVGRNNPDPSQLQG
jgi:hypothetical protein